MTDEPSTTTEHGPHDDAPATDDTATGTPFRLFNDDDDETLDQVDKTSSRHKLAMALIFLTISGAFVVVAFMVYTDEGKKIKIPLLEQQIINGKQEPQEQAFLLPGLWKPKTLKSTEALVADEDEVIGITVGKTYRAYQIKAFISNGGRVLNDIVGGTAVSVTYCDIWDNIRVFTLDTDGEEIVLGLAGWRNHQLDLNYEDMQYGQKTSTDIPLEDFPHERMSWLDWKTAHPETDIYLGDAIPHRQN